MQSRPIRRLAIGLAIVLSAAWQVYAQQQPAETAAVSQTYNHAPFRYQSRLLAERAQCRVYRLTYPSPVVTPVVQNNIVPADYYVPKNLLPGAKYPAVICLHILDGNEALTDLVCSVLAGRGVPAISFKLPYYGERGLPKGPEALADNPKLFVGAIAQVGEDIRRTVDLLASRPEINPERIGITGISLGAITAAAAAGAEPRLYRAGLILAGGDLLKIIYHCRETRELREMIGKLSPQDRAEVEAKIAEVDPLRFAPMLRDRAQAGRVLMINAGADEVIPRPCTEKLADALGIGERVVWFDGLGHYTAIAELPRALRMTAEFFAQDLPKEAIAAKTLGTEVPSPPMATSPLMATSPPTSALQRLVAVLQQLIAMTTTEPDEGRCHFLDVELSANAGGRNVASHLRLVRGAKGRFALRCQLPEIGEIALGQNRYPWMLAGGKTVIAGVKNPVANCNSLRQVDPRHLTRLRMAAGIGGSIALVPEMLQQWIAVEDDRDNDGRAIAKPQAALHDTGRAIRIAAKDQRRVPGDVRLSFADDGRTPVAATFTIAGVQGKLDFRGWQTNTIAPDALFEPPEGLQRVEVDQSDLCRMFAAVVNFAAERLDTGRSSADVRQPETLALVARDPAGHGMLCTSQGKWILMVAGTPDQMGAAHGALLRPIVQKLNERVVYLMGAADTLRSGRWFFDTSAEIERRTAPHTPPRFFAEGDALAKAAGVSARDARYANLFPERFHCSGIALCGKATAGGRVLHARVLDYLSDIDLQEAAAVMVFMPEGRYKWMTLGYAGFIGTVTAMNEKGLAIGEMGGGGQGQWDGIPMSFLLRDVMERAATADEAVEIIRNAPRTCEYYYVVSDRSGAMRGLCCTANEVTVLNPGQQHPRLPFIPEDAIIISGEDRAKLIGQRIQQDYGKIDVPKLIELIKRPVSMQGNLHDAIFAPETLDMWFADAGKYTPACDEPYAHVNLGELIQYYAGKESKSRQVREQHREKAASAEDKAAR